MRDGHVGVLVHRIIHGDLAALELGEVGRLLRVLRTPLGRVLNEGEAGAGVGKALVLALRQDDLEDVAVIAEEFLELLLLGLKMDNGSMELPP